MGFNESFKGISITSSSACKLLVADALCGLLTIGDCQPYRDSIISSSDFEADIAAVVAKRSGGMLSCQECKVLRDQCFENVNNRSLESKFVCVRMCSQICSIKNTRRDILEESKGNDNELSYDELVYEQ